MIGAFGLGSGLDDHLERAGVGGMREGLIGL
jgi:hypothetical protein